ncbi:MAG: WGR domain-containing protein, partial [Myxococcales bacterium]|nr:WGR domain-containing protein [Myxococcales bacterium]
MKLIKQTSLAFRVGTSDKVYEVDLCEVGTDQYVVNFRYGRRGAALRDGSKTVMPVSRAEADKIFDKLVSSKVSKGYQDAASLGAAPAAAAPTPSAPTPSGGRAGGPYRSAPSTTRGNASDR